MATVACMTGRHIERLQRIDNLAPSLPPTGVVDLLDVAQAAVDEDEGHGEAGHVCDDQRTQQVLEARL